MHLNRTGQAKGVSRWLTAGVVATVGVLALGCGPIASAAGDEALAPLVPDDKSPDPGERRVEVSFWYEYKHLREFERDAPGTRSGAEKRHAEEFSRVDGQLVAMVPDVDFLAANPAYANLSLKTGTPPEIFAYGPGGPGGKGRLVAFSCRFHGSVNEEDLKFGIVWPDPTFKWYGFRYRTRGDGAINWPNHPLFGSDEDCEKYLAPFYSDPSEFTGIVGCAAFMNLSGPDVENKFHFTFSGCWPQKSVVLNVGKKGVNSYTKHAITDLHVWSDGPPPATPPETPWTQRVVRTKDGLLATVSRTQKTMNPPEKGRLLPVLRDQQQTDERGAVRVTFQTADYEIVITPPAGLADWIPKGGRSEAVVGDKLKFKGKVRLVRGKPAAKPAEVEVRAELSTSRVPGVCVNFPRRGTIAPDLQFLPSKGFSVEPTGQSSDWAGYEATGKFKVGEEFTLTVGCFDYGPIGAITFRGSVPVRIVGSDGQTTLQLPQDENSNQIADAWETQEKIREKNLEATWDKVHVAGQDKDGDGICLYERYRGFRTRSAAHIRLRTDWKYVFVHDPDNVLTSSGCGAGAEFMNASAVVPILIGETQWTGQGSQAAGKRIVNFNKDDSLHAVDQHGLHVVRDMRDLAADGDIPTPRGGGWDAAYARSGQRPPNRDPNRDPNGMTLGYTFGYTWPDCLPLGTSAASPRDVYQIALYGKAIREYVNEVALFSKDPNERRVAQAKLATYNNLHRRDAEDGYQRLLKATTCHELGHGVGIAELLVPATHEASCYMRYMGMNNLTADDPYRCRYEPWPREFCKGSSGLRGGPGCHGKIRTSDNER
jgi:hypothetical protein